MNPRSVMIWIAVSVAFVTLTASSSMKTAVRLPSITITPGTAEKVITVDVHRIRAQVLDAAAHHDRDVTLEMDVEADRPPDVFFEVYIGLPKGRRFSAGNLALFGAGVRSEARGDFRPAHVQLVITKAIAGALGQDAGRKVQVAFVAKGAEGIGAVTSRATLKIDKGEIVIGPRLQQ